MRFPHPILWLCGLFLLPLCFLGVPTTQAQSPTLSLQVDKSVTTSPPTSRADLRERIASNGTIKNTGSEATDVTIVTAVYQDGQPVDIHVADRMSLEPGASVPVGGGRLPSADFFPTGDSGAGAIQEWADWLASWAPWNWGSETPARTPDCSLNSVDYTGCSVEQCALLPSPQKNACYAAGGSLIGTAVPIPSAGTTVVVAVVPLAEPGAKSGSGSVPVQGIILTSD